jgi:hypothetical protein
MYLTSALSALKSLGRALHGNNKMVDHVSGKPLEKIHLFLNTKIYQIYMSINWVIRDLIELECCAIQAMMHLQR